MKHIIDLHEENLLPPDTPLNDKSLVGSFAVTNLAIQDPALKTRKVEGYDRIGLDTSKYNLDTTEKSSVLSVIQPKQVANPVSKPEPPRKKDQKVLFRAPAKVQTKQKFEKVPILKKQEKKQNSKQKPIVVKKHETLPDKRKTVHQKRIYAKVSGYNKLYDV